ncbi:MAG: DNA (cytosine-5-)-methyltransferase [Planctomycetia bacterium]
MKEQYCLRSIPSDLWQWIEDHAHERRENINSLIISMLESARRDDRGYQSLFPDRPILRPAASSTLPFSFIDLFAGIGGFRLGLQRLGGRCVFSCERDPYCAKTYEAWFGDSPIGDINDVNPADIPDHDILAAGFPCQPFSIAGVSKKRSLGQADGFDCQKQGNLFFKICDIVKIRRPPVLILENVKNLKSHDQKRTWPVIEGALQDLGYVVYHKIIDAADYVPQHRERIFIVCFDRDVFGESPPFRFPEKPAGERPKFRSILEDTPSDKYTLTDHLWDYLQRYAEKHRAKGNGFGFGLADPEGVSRTLSARYYKDGSEVLIAQGPRKNPRRLTIVEAARLMGFRDVVASRDDVPVSDTQAYKQFGNSVVPDVVEAVGRSVMQVIASHLEKQVNVSLLKGKVAGKRQRKVTVQH